MRLIDLRTIRAEKISRGKTWLTSREDFPAPKIPGSGRGGALWDEAEVDAWLERFVAEENARAAAERPRSKQRRAAAAPA